MDHVNQTLYFYIVFYIPEDGPRGPKHAVNKHRLSCVDFVFDYLLYKRSTNGCPP